MTETQQYNVNMQVNLQIAKVKEVTTSHSAVGTLHATTLLWHHVQCLLVPIDCSGCLATTSLAAWCLPCVVCFHHLKTVDLISSLIFLYFIWLPPCWEGVVVKWGASRLVTSTWTMEAGSRVAQLVCNERKHAGLYSMDFNADTEDMPPFTIYTSGLCAHTNRSTACACEIIIRKLTTLYSL